MMYRRLMCLALAVLFACSVMGTAMAEDVTLHAVAEGDSDYAEGALYGTARDGFAHVELIGGLGDKPRDAGEMILNLLHPDTGRYIMLELYDRDSGTYFDGLYLTPGNLNAVTLFTYVTPLATTIINGDNKANKDLLFMSRDAEFALTSNGFDNVFAQFGSFDTLDAAVDTISGLKNATLQFLLKYIAAENFKAGQFTQAQLKAVKDYTVLGCATAQVQVNGRPMKTVGTPGQDQGRFDMTVYSLYDNVPAGASLRAAAGDGNVYVLHVAADGTATPIDSSRMNTDLRFSSEKTGDFFVVYAEKAPEGNTPKPDDQPKPGDGDADPTLPDTGDAAPLVAWTALLLLSGMVLIMLSLRRKRHE